jgi:hypothetical protein
MTSCTASAPPEAPSSVTLPQRWRGAIGFEDELTGDGRLIERNALSWETPFPLRYVSRDVGQHDGAQVVGTFEHVMRRPNGELYAEGTFDLGSAVGREAARQVQEETGNGISMDLDSVAFEIRIAGDLIRQERDGDASAEDVEASLKTDSAGRVTIMKVNPDDEVQVTTSARIRAATIVAIPAFADARITANPDSFVDISVGEDLDDLVASAAIPQEPSSEWFLDPQLSGPTALVVTDDGHVYGHLALWGTCHIAHPGGEACTTPPHSAAGYAYFHTGAVRTAQGTEIPVGHLTLDTRHAMSSASPSATMAHYENTGTAVADLVAGEDNYGIWVSGALRPNISPDHLRALRSAPLSGDWRRIGSSLELVAALAVNVPGFPVPRASGLVAGGAVTSLVAAGMVTHHRLPPAAIAALSKDDLRYLKKLLARERTNEMLSTPPVLVSEDACALARRVRGTSLTLRAHRRVPVALSTEG